MWNSIRIEIFNCFMKQYLLFALPLASVRLTNAVSLKLYNFTLILVYTGFVETSLRTNCLTKQQNESVCGLLFCITTHNFLNKHTHAYTCHERNRCCTLDMCTSWGRKKTPLLLISFITIYVLLTLLRSVRVKGNNITRWLNMLLSRPARASLWLHEG